MSRIGALFRRFQLPPQATKADLKAAYLRQAKQLHPDVAGKSSEQQFRQLKEEYDEAMELLRKGPDVARTFERKYPTEARAPPRWQDSHFHAGADWRSAQRPRQAAPAQPQTSAQRVRNMLFVAGSVVGAAVLFASGLSTQPAAPRQRQPEMSPGAAADALAAGGAAHAVERKDSAKREVSSYYKSRSKKSTVRVHSGNNVYEGEVDSLKSRQPAPTEAPGSEPKAE